MTMELAHLIVDVGALGLAVFLVVRGGRWLGWWR